MTGSEVGENPLFPASHHVCFRCENTGVNIELSNPSKNSSSPAATSPIGYKGYCSFQQMEKKLGKAVHIVRRGRREVAVGLSVNGGVKDDELNC